MLTAVIDLDYHTFPEQIALPEHYEQVLALVRIAGVPVGQIYVPLVRGQISDADLRVQIDRNLGRPACERWVHHTLGLDRAAPGLSDASVVVCSHKRLDSLQRCLESLVALPDDGQELLVIDDSPADQRITAIVETFPCVRYIQSDRPGLSTARNLAMREARGAIVAFVDADAVVDPGWLRALLSGFADPLVACVTGLTMPLELETEAQRAFDRWKATDRTFIRREFYNCWYDPLRADEIGSGNNMAVRRSAWREIGPFSTAFGSGSDVGSGEAGLWFNQALTWGFRIIYEPTALIWQRHSATEVEILALARSNGMSCSAQIVHQLLLWNEARSLESIARILMRYLLPRLMRGRDHQSEALFAPITVAWLWGCLEGLWAYLAARRQIRLQGGEL
ncbi:MAG: glycosyltransferase family 2 protein [Oscillochloris sp.]|nr:glycosyltransferase family 2 protein [Oscillochloris sp.]